MKKNLKLFAAAILLFCAAASFSFAQQYQITKVSYDIVGCGWTICPPTMIYPLERNVPVDTKKVFESEEEFNKYVERYSRQLNNLRQFTSISVEKEFVSPALEEDESITKVTLLVTLYDSYHFIGIPFFKYNSNTGSIFQIKVEDTNFMGTLNKLSSDLFFQIKPVENSSENDNIIGLNFQYDYPFKAGIFDATWVNKDTFSYTFGNSSPEWNLTTGLRLELPQNQLTWTWEFLQSTSHNLEYAKFDDEYYFTEFAEFSTPLKLYEIVDFKYLIYKPYINFTCNWDANGINELNADLLSPSVEIGHSLKADIVDWEGQFRNGYSINLTNGYNYNFERNLLNPYISLDTKLYKALSFMGLNADSLIYLSFIEQDNRFYGKDGYNIGQRMRGIKDSFHYISGDYAGELAVVETAVIAFNFDMPIRIFRTSFERGLLSKLNFEVQASLFTDIALCYNKVTKDWFNPKDGLYTAGLEVLVYPAKFSSFVLRASLGFDLTQTLLKDCLNTKWREETTKYEFSFGIGLLY